MKKRTSLKTLLLVSSVAGSYSLHYFLSWVLAVPYRNDGVSFGIEILGGALAVSGLLILGLVCLYYKKPSTGLLVLIAGAMGNFLDRFFWGSVADYWLIPGTGVYNNINDWLIALGLIWLIIEVWKKREW